MKHSRFKYFSKLEYAEQFMAGSVFCQTAAFLRDYEDAQAQQIIGDEYEGTRLYRPVTFACRFTRSRERANWERGGGQGSGHSAGLSEARQSTSAL